MNISNKVIVKAMRRAGGAIRETRTGTAGYTLIEILIVMAILGSVLTAVFALYNVQNRTTTIEEDIVDVQQNLRIGIERIVKDLRMSGFTIAGPVNPINAMANNTGMDSSDLVTLETPSAEGIYARISASITTNLATATPVTFTVSSPEEVDLFATGDIVRIFNSSERDQPANMYFTVTATSRTGPSITVTPSGTATGVLFSSGFIMAKTGDSAPDTYPNTIQYCLGPSSGCGSAVTTCSTGQCLMRIVNGVSSNADVVAENIQDVQFKYILDGSSAEVDTTANLTSIRAVRVSLTAKNYQTEALSGNAKTRDIITVVKMRNR
ncbi:MAG: hypothetical protein BMS9Abin23_0702 [Thermodesulfobacteriota bacterium]|nr:MAG: hypothetical protein BMS9Abin23_0702 [Thermodesulfobacteriota bacterium]